LLLDSWGRWKHQLMTREKRGEGTKSGWTRCPVAKPHPRTGGHGLKKQERAANGQFEGGKVGRARRGKVGKGLCTFQGEGPLGNGVPKLNSAINKLKGLRG